MQHTASATATRYSRRFITRAPIFNVALQNRFVWFTRPKNLLLVDSIGALATSFGTGLLAARYLPTGLPTWILLTLSVTAAAYASFDLIAYVYSSVGCVPLAVIGLLNLIYCFAAITTCLVFRPQTTILEVSYFTIEAGVVIPLALYELAVAKCCWRERSKIRSTDRKDASTSPEFED